MQLVIAAQAAFVPTKAAFCVSWSLAAVAIAPCLGQQGLPASF